MYGNVWEWTLSSDPQDHQGRGMGGDFYFRRPPNESIGGYIDSFENMGVRLLRQQVGSPSARSKARRK